MLTVISLTMRLSHLSTEGFVRTINKIAFLRTFLIVYGALHTLIFGSVLISLYLHGDLEIARGYLYPDINFALLVLFGVSTVVAAIFWRKRYTILPMITALALTVSVLYLRALEPDAMRPSVWVIAVFLLLLFLLPASVVMRLSSTRESRS